MLRLALFSLFFSVLWVFVWSFLGWFWVLFAFQGPPPGQSPKLTKTAPQNSNSPNNSYLSLLRVLFKACASAREPSKKAVYAECAPQLVPSLTALLAILDGPNCSEVGVWCFFLCGNFVVLVVFQ